MCVAFVKQSFIRDCERKISSSKPAGHSVSVGTKNLKRIGNAVRARRHSAKVVGHVPAIQPTLGLLP